MNQTCDVKEEPNQVHKEAASAVITVADLPSCLRFLAFTLKICPCSRKSTCVIPTNITQVPHLGTKVDTHLGDPVEVVPPEPPQRLPRLDVPRFADQPVRGLGYAHHPHKGQDGERAEHRRLHL